MSASIVTKPYSTARLAERVCELRASRASGFNPWDVVDWESALDKRALCLMYTMDTWKELAEVYGEDLPPKRRRRVEEPRLGSPAYTVKLRRMK